MNIGNMLDENAPRKSGKKASLVDHRWMEDGLIHPGQPSFTPTGEIGKKDNNIKPALQLEWGMGNIAPLFEDSRSGVVKRNIPEDYQSDAGPVIVFARDQMNRGVMGNKLIAALKAKFPPKTLVAAAHGGLRQQLALEGIVGCIAVDGRGYKSCKAALAASQQSPFKRYIKYVIGCNCGTPHMMPIQGDGKFRAAASTGNAVDDFFASDVKKPQATMVAHCHSTMMPIMARGDLDSSEMDETLLDVMNITELPVGMGASIRKSKASNLRKIQIAFKSLVSLRDQREANKYSGKTESAGFVIDTEERPVEIIDSPEKFEELDVDPVNHASDNPVNVARKASTSVDIESLRRTAQEFEPDEDNTPNSLDIELENITSGAQTRINPKRAAQAQLQVDAPRNHMSADQKRFMERQANAGKVVADIQMTGKEQKINVAKKKAAIPELDVQQKTTMAADVSKFMTGQSKSGKVTGDVDLRHASDLNINVNQARKAKTQLSVEHTAPMASDVSRFMNKQAGSGPEKVSVEIEEASSKVQLNSKKNIESELTIDSSVASMDTDLGEFAPQDVEMEQFLDPEFEGTDEFAVDDAIELQDELDMDAKGTMTI